MARKETVTGELKELLTAELGEQIGIENRAHARVAAIKTLLGYDDEAEMAEETGNTVSAASKSKRVRRTKAQIAADKAAEEAKMREIEERVRRMREIEARNESEAAQ